MKRHLLSALALTLSSAATAQAPAAKSGRWEMSNQSSPLTGARTTAAAVESTNQLANMLGNAARASLVIRCGEGGLAVYVNWPQVVKHDGENFAGQLKTFAIWRIDDAKIQANLWDMDSTRTAAGEFKSKNALKFLTSIAVARKLVVRLGRRTITSRDALAIDERTGC
jgi:hypothetical protein